MLEKVQQDRLAKLEQVRALGIDPYGPVAGYKTAEAIAAVVKKYEEAYPQIAQITQKGKKEAKASVASGKSAESAKSADEKPADEKMHGDAAGRLVLYRDMGKMIFAHIRDDSGSMQIALRKNALDEKSWALAKLLDLGDIVAAAGPVERTRTGEVTIWASKLTLLCKSLNPMPEKFHGLSDVETRYRRRYLDLMANPESLQRFQKRVQIINLFRDILVNKRGFIEVETPILQPIYGGAAARPFTTHHNTLDCDLFMRISPELYLKRLLVGGMGKVFEIGRNFRNEGIDTRHNPEFTMMELYQANADYEVMMEITEELVGEAARTYTTKDALESRCQQLTLHKKDLDEAFKKGEREVRDEMRVIGKTIGTQDPEFLSKRCQLVQSKIDELKKIPEVERSVLDRLEGMMICRGLLEDNRLAIEYGRAVIDFTRGSWRKRSYDELMLEHAGVSIRNPEAVRKRARSLGIEESNKDDAVIANEVFEAIVEPALAKPDACGVLRPTFVKDYPAELCPLTRRKADDPSIALRFECFVAGMEIANAYTELNDPAVQEENFRQQVRGEAEGETMRVMDEDFVTALRHGMPPAGGLGLGIDRVVMLLTNTQSIRDVILFPLLRPE